MLALTRIEQIPAFVFFHDTLTLPTQVPPDSGELRSHKLRALVLRLAESHRMAFFAQAVLLLEGPSDEIIANGLIARLDLQLPAGGAQIVPVTGKGSVGESAKLFRMMGQACGCPCGLGRTCR